VCGRCGSFAPCWRMQAGWCPLRRRRPLSGRCRRLSQWACRQRAVRGLEVAPVGQQNRNSRPGGHSQGLWGGCETHRRSKRVLKYRLADGIGGRLVFSGFNNARARRTSGGRRSNTSPRAESGANGRGGGGGMGQVGGGRGGGGGGGGGGHRGPGGLSPSPGTSQRRCRDNGPAGRCGGDWRLRNVPTSGVRTMPGGLRIRIDRAIWAAVSVLLTGEPVMPSSRAGAWRVRSGLSRPIL